jgi:hypothetical protein
MSDRKDRFDQDAGVWTLPAHLNASSPKEYIQCTLDIGYAHAGTCFVLNMGGYRHIGLRSRGVIVPDSVMFRLRMMCYGTLGWPCISWTVKTHML